MPKYFKLIKHLGIKVYFDEDNKPYVLSHELAELIEKKPGKVLRDINDLLKKIENIDCAKIGCIEKHLDITMIEDFYIVKKKVGNNEGEAKEKTYRLYKDLLLIYILGLTGQGIIEFKLKYVAAFNYIEQEYNLLMQKHVRLKENFLKMFNQVVKRNGELHIDLKNARS